MKIYEIVLGVLTMLTVALIVYKVLSACDDIRKLRKMFERPINCNLNFKDENKNES